MHRKGRFDPLWFETILLIDITDYPTYRKPLNNYSKANMQISIDYYLFLALDI